MKTFTQNIKNIGIITAIALLAFVFFPFSPVSADHATGAVSFNSLQADRDTVRVANHTRNPNQWSNTITAVDGDEVSVAIYYHNSGTETAVNTGVSVDTKNTGYAFSHNITGYVDADNYSGLEQDSATVNISGGNGKLTYKQGSVKWYPNQRTSASSLLFGQNGTEIFNGWLELGDVDGTENNSGNHTFSTQGSVVVTYIVDAETTNSYECNDGIDNDNDGDIDYPDDPGCSSSTDNSEYNSTQGNNDPDVVTDSEDEKSNDIELNGNVDMKDFDNGEVFFAWSNDRNDIEDVEDEDTVNDVEDISSDIEVEIVSSDQDSNDGREYYTYDIDKEDLDNDEDYYYAICVLYEDDNNDDVIECGGIEKFDNGNDGGEDPRVTTKSATSINKDYATLRGSYDMRDDADNGTAFFVYSTDKDDIDDTDREDNINDVEDISNDIEVVEVKDNLDENDDDSSVSKKVTNLDEDEKYYFALCLEYDDVDNDQNIKCGSTLNFTTDDNGGNGDAPDVATGSPSFIGVNSAVCTGTYDGNGEDTEVRFRYGSTSSVTSRTVWQQKGSNSGSFVSFVSGLKPNATNYCQAEARNDEGEDLGNLVSFKTTTGSVNLPPTTIVTGGGNSAYVELDIDDHTESAVSRGIHVYDVTWKNISRSELSEVDLRIVLPKSLRYGGSTDGIYSKRDHAILVHLGDLDPGDEGEMMVTTRVRSLVRGGEIIVSQAILAFETPSDAQMAAIEHDTNTIESFGRGIGFFGSIIGWLLLIIAILILLMILRRSLKDRKRNDREEELLKYLKEMDSKDNRGQADVPQSRGPEKKDTGFDDGINLPT